MYVFTWLFFRADSLVQALSMGGEILKSGFFIKSWIEVNYGGEKEIGPLLQKLFDRYIEPTLTYIKKSCKFNVPIS